MANQIINIGTTANDGTGDQLRDAFDKANDNFLEIYTGTASVVRQTAPADRKGASGDVAGMIAVNSFANSIWMCYATWTDGVANIWREIDISTTTTHVADATIHFTEASISLTESQISDLQAYAVVTAVPALPHGVAGNLAGMIAYESGFLYVCILDYVNDTTVSWQRVAITATNATTW